LQDVQHTWDAAGNLTQRDDVVGLATENFEYDPLDRLTSPGKTAAVYSLGEANGDGVIDSLDMDYVGNVYLGLSPVTPGCDANRDGQVNMMDITAIQRMLFPYYTTYDSTGNITNLQGRAYTYGNNAGPHAVTQIGSTSYTYDANGNMTTRGSQTLTWDAENRLVSVSGGSNFIGACPELDSGMVTASGSRKPRADKPTSMLVP
jgi:YD repeat-containing protein